MKNKKKITKNEKIVSTLHFLLFKYKYSKKQRREEKSKIVKELKNISLQRNNFVISYIILYVSNNNNFRINAIIDKLLKIALHVHHHMRI